MTKGTASFGKHNKKHTHVRCPRCGRSAYHDVRKICASCGYGRSSRLRN